MRNVVCFGVEFLVDEILTFVSPVEVAELHDNILVIVCKHFGTALVVRCLNLFDEVYSEHDLHLVDSLRDQVNLSQQVTLCLLVVRFRSLELPLVSLTLLFVFVITG